MLGESTDFDNVDEHFPFNLNDIEEEQELSRNEAMELDALISNHEDATSVLPAPAFPSFFSNQPSNGNFTGINNVTSLSTSATQGSRIKESAKVEESPTMPKPKIERAKLNAERVRGLNGLHRLLELSKKFKHRGKSHLAADLKVFIQLYEDWGHELFPKYRSVDFIPTLEKQCHSKDIKIYFNAMIRSRRTGESVDSILGLDPLSESDEEIDEEQEDPSTGDQPSVNANSIREAALARLAMNNAPIKPIERSEDMDEEFENIMRGL